jgi:hypothetical protein
MLRIPSTDIGTKPVGCRIDLSEEKTFGFNLSGMRPSLSLKYARRRGHSGHRSKKTRRQGDYTGMVLAGQGELKRGNISGRRESPAGFVSLSPRGRGRVSGLFLSCNLKRPTSRFQFHGDFRLVEDRLMDEAGFGHAQETFFFGFRDVVGIMELCFDGPKANGVFGVGPIQ